MGTLEQVIVSPIRPWQLVLGKLFPFACVGFLDTLLVSAVAVGLFRVPLRGSLALLILLTMPFLLCTLGLGLFVSTLVRTQQQAMMSAVYLVMVPMIYLSGLIFPVENMPAPIQKFTVVIPLKYYAHIIRGIFLKGSGLDVLWPDAAGAARDRCDGSGDGLSQVPKEPGSRRKRWRHACSWFGTARPFSPPRTGTRARWTSRSPRRAGAQARALGTRLAGEALAAVYASPMSRARDTAELITAGRGLRRGDGPRAPRNRPRSLGGEDSRGNPCGVSRRVRPVGARPVHVRPVKRRDGASSAWRVRCRRFSRSWAATRTPRFSSSPTRRRFVSSSGRFWASSCGATAIAWT